MAVLVLGLISLIVTFLIGVLSAFPLSGAAVDTSIPPSATESTLSLDVEAVEEVGERFSTAYHSLLEDIISFQHDPSLARAEARRDEFVSYAQQVIQLNQDFAQKLGDKLDGLTLQSNEESSQ